MSGRSYSSKVYSPTSIQSYADSPIKWLMNKYMMKNYERNWSMGGSEHIKGTVENYAGTSVHKAMEEGFKFLKEKAIPGGENLSQAITQSYRHAIKSLNLDGHGLHKEHGGFIRKMLRKYGKEYGDSLARGEKVDLMIEETYPIVVGEPKPHSPILRGRFDLAIVNHDKKVAKVIDWKNMFDAKAVDNLEKMGWQPKAYTYGMFKMFPDVDKVDFVYETSLELGTGKRQAHTIPFPGLRRSANLSNIESDLLHIMSEMESQKQIVYERLNKEGREGLKKYMSSLLLARSSTESQGIAACTNAYMRYTCSTDQFLQDIIEWDYTKGQRLISSKAKTFNRVTDTEFNKHEENIFGLKEEIGKKEFIQQRLRQMESEKGLKPEELSKRISSETDTIERSYKALKSLSRGRYKDELTRSQFSARTKIPFSILDSKEIKAPWLTEKMRRGLKSSVNQRIQEITKDLDVPFYTVDDIVTDRIFTDKDFVQKMHWHVAGKIQQQMKNYKLSINKTNLDTILKRPDLFMDKNLAYMLDDKIERETIHEVLRQQRGKIEKHMGKLDPKLLRNKDALEAIKIGLVDKGVLKTNPNVFMEQMARNESFSGISKRFRLSRNKFPISIAAITTILSYMSGASFVKSQLFNKMEKAANQFIMGKDEEIEAGQHSSAYTTSRRLLMSDFGSKFRKFSPISSIASFFKTKGEKGIKLIKDTNSRLSAEQIKKNTREMPEMINKMVNTFNNTPLAPYALFGGVTAGAFVATSFLPNIKTDREIGKDIDERKKRFKRLKEATWNKDSSMLEPKSDLRAAYGLHSPFGSGAVAVTKLLGNTFKTVMGINPGTLISEFVKKIWMGGNLLRGSYEGSTNAMLKAYSKVKGIKVGTDGFVANDAQTHIKNAIYDASNSIRYSIQKASIKDILNKSSDKAKKALYNTKNSIQKRKLDEKSISSQHSLETITALQTIHSTSRAEPPLIIDRNSPTVKNRIISRNAQNRSDILNRRNTDNYNIDKIKRGNNVEEDYYLHNPPGNPLVTGTNNTVVPEWNNISLDLDNNVDIYRDTKFRHYRKPKQQTIIHNHTSIPKQGRMVESVTTLPSKNEIRPEYFADRTVNLPNSVLMRAIWSNGKATWGARGTETPIFDYFKII